MIRLLEMFVSILILIIVLRIFSPGLANALVELTTNVVVLANEAVVALQHNAEQQGLVAGQSSSP
jgi:hypothetical protein